MSLSEIKIVTEAYNNAVKKYDWPKELECLASLKLLYSRENNREKDTRRIVAKWKEALERNIKAHRSKISPPKLRTYSEDLKNCYKYESEYLFESFLFFMEWDRPKAEKFYHPRQKQLKQCVDALQDLADGKIKILGISMPPRVGKTTIALLFCLWIGAKEHEKSVFASGHSTSLMKSFYDGIYEFSTSDRYNFKQIFPNAQLVDTDAKNLMIDLGEPKRYKTFSFRSIDSNMSGTIEATSLLYVDDLISGSEEASKPERLENAFAKYVGDIKQRRKTDVPLLMVGTRWSLNDPIGIESREHAEDANARFIVIPATDDMGHSNFNYPYGVGFTDAYYAERKHELDMIDEALYACIYQQEPFEGAGICFGERTLNRYYGNETLNRADKIGTFAFVDVAWGGGDSLSMPIGEVYIVGDIRRVYITEWVFSREDKSITQPLVEMAISSNKVQEVRFESNNGGSEYAEEIGKRLRAQGYPCRMTWGKAPSTTAKASKIRQYAPDIKTYFYFLDREHQSSAYKRAFTELTSWLITGKSIHDDAPDSLSGLSEMILGNRIGIVTAGIDRNRYRL